MPFYANTEDAKRARELIRRAPRILNDINQAYIIQHRGHEQRSMPQFQHDEVELGRTLGVGGFGIVNEITAFDIDFEKEKKEAEEKAQKEREEAEAAAAAAAAAAEAAANDNSNEDEKKSGDTKAEDGEADDAAKGDEKKGTEEKAELSIENLAKHSGHVGQSDRVVTSANLTAMGDDHENVHYDVVQAREVMSKRTYRKGTTRYALKRLHDNLTDLERARGMIDLAIEAKYLSVVWHPNIVKMRGMATGDPLDDDFFIIMDRLYGTLDQRMKQWKQTTKKHKGMFGVIGANKSILQEILQERMIVAYDLAVAFWYLHENRLVYRDIKPENIGFDIRGDVKVFDFGLCKTLDPRFKNKSGGYGYRMTARAGSLPYMSPEVAQCKHYDTKCDVYSYAILLWELLSLGRAFKGYSHDKFIDKVYKHKERPKISKSFPPLTRLVLPEAWDDDPLKRPDMKRVAIMVRGDLNEMTTDENVRNRTQHMDNQSDRSLDNSWNEKN